VSIAVILPYPARNFWPEVVLLILLTGNEAVRLFLSELQCTISCKNALPWQLWYPSSNHSVVAVTAIWFGFLCVAFLHNPPDANQYGLVHVNALYMMYNLMDIYQQCLHSVRTGKSYLSNKINSIKPLCIALCS